MEQTIFCPFCRLETAEFIGWCSGVGPHYWCSVCEAKIALPYSGQPEAGNQPRLANLEHKISRERE